MMHPPARSRPRDHSTDLTSVPIHCALTLSSFAPMVPVAAGADSVRNGAPPVSKRTPEHRCISPVLSLVRPLPYRSKGDKRDELRVLALTGRVLGCGPTRRPF